MMILILMILILMILYRNESEPGCGCDHPRGGSTKVSLKLKKEKQLKLVCVSKKNTILLKVKNYTYNMFQSSIHINSLRKKEIKLFLDLSDSLLCHLVSLSANVVVA